MATIFPSVSLPQFFLPDALDAIDRAESPAARLQAAADGLHAMGFERVVATLRDGTFTATMIVKAGREEPGIQLDALPAAVWRRRIATIERFRAGDVYLLDGTDPFVAREFFGREPVGPSDDAREWLDTDLVLALLRGVEGEIIGIVKMAKPRDGRRPTETRCQEIGWLLRHTSSRLAHDAIRALAQRRAQRLQRLQEAGAALARSLDEAEIVRELVRQAIRATGADGAMLAIPDLDSDSLVTAFRLVHGAERAREPIALANGVIAHVARSGRPFRVGDREADRAHQRVEDTQPLPSLHDIADLGPAPSILAVPLLVGIRLVGVLAIHAESADVFSAEDEEVLATMASQAATAIANARRYAESERERRQTEALADVARAVSESLRQGEVFRLILRHAISLLRAEGACIALRSDDYMHIVAAVGAADVLAGVHLPVASSLLGHAVTTGELLISNDFDNDPNSSKAVRRLARIERSVIAPLVTARGTIGAIAVLNRKDAFSAEDARVLKRLSDQVSVAIVNARLFEEVERATREWKVAFDAIASGMVVLDDSGRVMRCNARAAELVERPTVHQLLDEPFVPMLLGDGETQAALEALLRDGRDSGTTVRATMRDARRGRLFDLTAAPHPDGGCVITFDDVTEMHALTERHRRVLETASEAIIITGIDRRVVFANPAAQAMFGRGDLIGMRTIELIPADAHERLLRAESAAMSGTAQRYELPMMRADGAIRQVSISSAPLLEVGQITGTVACLRDVTDHRADALALARSEARYTRLVESASDAIFTVDLRGCFTSVNRALVEGVGRPRDLLISSPWVGIVDARDRQIADLTFDAVRRGERQKVQLRLLGAAEQVRVGSLLLAPVIEDHAVVGALGVVRDITEEELHREAVAQQEQLASMGRVLGGIANELNNPLSSLLAVAELEATSSTLGDADRHAVEQIRDEARRASRIVRHLLGVSRERTVDRTSVRINRVVRETLDLHGYALRDRQVPVRLELCDSDPAVQGNTPQLEQVLINLLENAREAFEGWNGRREIVIRTRVEGDCASIVVADSGPGIGAAHLPRVFEPLFTTRMDNQMRGLGLAVAAAVVKDHGGRIDVTSRPGSGAIFTVTLPLLMSGTTSVTHTTEATGMRSVLVVEDEATLRQAVERFLSRHGFAVTAVESGAAALAAVANGAYDVILLDLRMYGMQGDEVYRTLLAEAPEHAARVVFVTGDMHNPDVAQFLASTGRPALAKPFQLAELMAYIEATLRMPSGG